MKYIKRALLLLLVMALTLALAACFGTEDTGCTEHEDANNDGKCDICDTVIDNGDEGGKDSIKLIENGTVKVQVVIDFSNYVFVKQQFQKLADTLAEFGAELKIVSPADASAADYEILVGEGTNRGEKYDYDNHKLGPDGMAVQIIDSKIIIAGGSTDSLLSATKKFISDTFGSLEDASTLPNITLEVSDCYEQFHDPDDYRWSDVKINGNDANDYVIVADLTKRVEGAFVYANAAQYIRDTFYSTGGKWMEILDSGKLDEIPDKAIVISFDESVKSAGGFKTSLEGNRLKISTYYPAQLEESVKSFVGKFVIKKGELKIDKTLAASTEELRYIYYEDYGAKGDGRTNDFEAMRLTHEYANKYDHIVKANDKATYYISDTRNYIQDVQTIEIQTDVIWGNCKIVIDDTAYTYLDAAIIKGSIFTVKSDSKEKLYLPGDEIVDAIVAGGGFKTTTKKINYAPGMDVMLIPFDDTHKVYIREGLNADPGSSQHEVFIIHADGTLDENTPVMLDYNNISWIYEYRIDDKPITISGGLIQTKANASRCDYDYFYRNFCIKRSNVTIKNVERLITDEGDTGAPYSGFFAVQNCNNVRFENCVFQAHRMYWEEREVDAETGNVTMWGSAMGTYDLSGGNSNNIYYYKCTQRNFYAPGTEIQSNTFYDENGATAINNQGDTATLWGVMGTNYCKNITYDECKLNRFDAHCGVHNATIKNSEVSMINLIGSGTALIDNSTVWNNAAMISLRGDYGSTWNGSIIIKNVKWRTGNGDRYIVSGSYKNHYFGYETYLPSVEVDNLTLLGSDAQNVYLFSGFELEMHEDPSLSTIRGTDNKNIMHYPTAPDSFVVKNNSSGYRFAVAPAGSFFGTFQISQK